MDTERLLYEAAYLWSYYDHFCASDIAVDPAYDILKHLINIVFCILDLSFVSYIKAINIKYSHISFPHNFFIVKKYRNKTLCPFYHISGLNQSDSEIASANTKIFFEQLDLLTDV